MSEIKVKRNRPRDEEVVRAKFVLTRATKDRVAEAATASGVSLGLYLERLLTGLSPSGTLPVLDTALDIPEEFVIKPAA